MIMKRVVTVRTVVMVAVFATASVAIVAQQPQPATQGVVMKQRVFQTPDGGPPSLPGGDIFFMDQEFNFGGKTVKGAPYSAQAVTETIQTLGDGNRIINRSTSALYRDSDGRTRREVSIKMFGVLGDSGAPLQTIFINDPVAGVSYSLDSKTKTAHKSVPFQLKFDTADGVHKIEDAQGFEFKLEGPTTAGVAVRTAPPGAPGPVELQAKQNAEYNFKIQTEEGAGAGAVYMFRRSGTNENAVKEDLGKQTVEGVEAQGTRVTITIPAGEIGNERPIEIVNERWYSPELQVDVMTRHNDPRTGETTYRLTNINRADPGKSLFEIPSDYTITEGFKLLPAIAPAKMRKPEQEQ